MGLSKVNLSVIFTICLSTVLANTRPPGISIQPAHDIFYKVGEPVQIQCVADGEPQPTYVWKRNNLILDIGDTHDRIVQLPNVGTIAITRPEDRDEGVYQCLADNGYGVSASKKVNLRLAKLDSFVYRPTMTSRPSVGNPLTLTCVSPNSVPTANISWTKKDELGRFIPISYNARVTMDLENSLRITNIHGDDDGEYSCMAINNVVRGAQQGQLNRISSMGEIAVLNRARYMWSSPTDQFGLYGDEFKLKCIFSGNPTPDVHWIKTNGSLPDTAKIGRFGQELQFESLQFSVAGEYECWASNTLSIRREVRLFSVRVESRPYWKVEPKDVEVVIGGTARYTCIGDGFPAPQRHWYINNVLLRDVTDPRITQGGRFHVLEGGDTLELVNVTMEDTMVVQCNVTNKHGYIFSDVYLNVLSEAPTIIG